MISTNQITKVECGKEGVASIAVIARSNRITIQSLATEKKICDKLNDGDIMELPQIQIDFFDPKSIDVFIKALECIRHNITPPSYCLAS